MAIVVLENKKVLAVEKADFERVKLEKALENSIAENPEILGLKELDDNLEILVLGQQFDNIDVLGIDQYGKIYIIETKRFKNPDKREVVAQTVDYGACLWRDYGVGTVEASGRFWSKVEQKVREQHGVDIDEKLRGFISSLREEAEAEVLEREETAEKDLDDAVASLKSRIEGNLREGNFRFVVAMDQLDDGIKNHIAFLNKVTGDDFWVLGVELEFYNTEKYKELQIVVPTMYGNEPIEKRGTTLGAVWDESKYLEALARRVTPDLVEVGRDLYEWSEKEFGRPRWTPTGTFIPELDREGGKHRTFYVNTNGNVQLDVPQLTKTPPFPSNDELLNKLREKLNLIPEVHIEAQDAVRFPGPHLKSLRNADMMKTFKDALLWWKEQVMSYQGSDA